MPLILSRAGRLAWQQGMMVFVVVVVKLLLLSPGLLERGAGVVVVPVQARRRRRHQFRRPHRFYAPRASVLWVRVWWVVLRVSL